MQTVQITEAQPPKGSSLTGFTLSTLQKGGLLVLILGLFYLRLILRRRKRELICPHCGHRNPQHMGNCGKCSAPLFRA